MAKLYFLASKGISLTSRIIRWWQFGFPYTHIAIVLDLQNKCNPLVAEMWWDGLRIGYFYKTHTLGTHFAVYSVNVDDKKYNKFNEELKKIIDKNPKYDWLGILGFPLRSKDIENSNRFFCSELAFYLCQKSDINLLINTYPSEVSPRLFLKSPLLQFEYYYNGKKILNSEPK